MPVELVSVERPLWSGDATAVFARTLEGEIGVFRGHEPLLAALEPGFVVRIERESEGELVVAAHGGFLSVSPEGVSVLAEMAETADEIDASRAREALARAGDADDPESVSARQRAMARLRAVGEQV